MVKILCAYCFIFFMMPVSAQQSQQHKRDSMIGLLKTFKDDTSKVKLLNRIGDEFAYSDFKTASHYYEEGLVLSKKLDFTRGIIRYYSSQGEILNMNGQYAECMSLLKQGYALSISKKDKMRRGIMAENIGNTFALMEKIDSAVEYYYEALAIFEEFNDSAKIANVYSDLSSVFVRTDKLEKALEFAEKSLAISKNNKDGFYLSGLVNKEAVLWQLKEYSKADAINDEIIQLAEKQEDDLALCNALSNYCNHSAKRQDYRQLYDNAEKFLIVAGRMESDEQLMIAKYWLALANYYKKNYNEAGILVTEVIKKAEALKNLQRMKESYFLFAKILLVNKGDVVMADKYNDMADSIEQLTLNDNILKAVHNAEQKYETAKKQSQINSQASELKDKRIQNIILIVSLILVMLVLLFFILWMRNRQRLSNQQKVFQEQRIIQLENEKQLTATQAVLRGQEEERSRLAKDLHDGLGGILSSAKYSFSNMKQNFILSEDNALAFERSMNMLDQSITELRRVAHNMMPETLMKLSLNEALQDYSQQITQSGVLKVTYQSFGMEGLVVDNTIKTTVYRIVQELTNNIIKHAHAATAMVQVIVKEQVLNITIEDDGEGFDTTLLKDAGGIGYKNTLSRVSFLRGTFDIQSKKGEGTSVYIEIPLPS